ncbi:hypothetical protein ScPMuIL_009934 [Solemya velum]
MAAPMQNGCSLLRAFIQSGLRVPPASVSAALWRSFHSDVPLRADFDPEAKGPLDKYEPKTWLTYNDIVYPPQKPGEPRRPADIFNMRTNIRSSHKKMWYTASMIRGMTIDEALKQLTFNKKKASTIIKEILEETQDIAVRDHNVEYKSNLWIAQSFVGKAHTIKGARKHARPRYGVVHYRYCHYFVRLMEGLPPAHYYPLPQTGYEKIDEYITEQRARRIIRAL